METVRRAGKGKGKGEGKLTLYGEYHLARRVLPLRRDSGQWISVGHLDGQVGLTVGFELG